MCSIKSVWSETNLDSSCYWSNEQWEITWCWSFHQVFNLWTLSQHKLFVCFTSTNWTRTPKFSLILYCCLIFTWSTIGWFDEPQTDFHVHTDGRLRPGCSAQRHVSDLLRLKVRPELLGDVQECVYIVDRIQHQEPPCDGSSSASVWSFHTTFKKSVLSLTFRVWSVRWQKRLRVQIFSFKVYIQQFKKMTHWKNLYFFTTMLLITFVFIDKEHKKKIWLNKR